MLTRVLVCGGRDADIDEYVAEDCIEEIIEEFEDGDIEFVSGTARGGDRIGEIFAKNHDYPITRFVPDWKTYGRAAGPIRNEQMIDYIEESDNPIVIAFWDHSSKGTRHTIKTAKSRHIPVYIVGYKNYSGPIKAGIQLKDNELVFNWKEDEPEDILPLVDQRITQSKKHGHVFYYAFKANKQEDDWGTFLTTLKHSDDLTNLRKLTDQIANRFIAKFNRFDCILYPKSSSILNELMIDSLHDIDPYIPAYPIDKLSPQDITFDWDTFKEKYNGSEEDYAEVSKRIEKMIDRIHRSDRFSMQKQVIPRYRKFISGFLNLEDLNVALDDILASDTVLILDDIVTSGSTTQQMIKMLDSIGYEGDIVVYSLLYNK